MADGPDVAGRNGGHCTEPVVVPILRLRARDTTPTGAVPVQDLRAADGPDIGAGKGGDAVEGPCGQVMLELLTG